MPRIFSKSKPFLAKPKRLPKGMDKAVSPVGPIFVGSIVEVEVDENGAKYAFTVYPDKNNPLLRRNGKRPYYYFLPTSIRIAQQSGRPKLSYLHIMREEQADNSLASVAGILSFTTLMSYPQAVFEKLKAAATRELQTGVQEHYKLEGLQPIFSELPLSNVQTIVHSLDLNDVTDGADNRFAFLVEGEGQGAISMNRENAFTCRLGGDLSEVVKRGFEGPTSPISIQSDLEFYVYSLVSEIKVTLDWGLVRKALKASAVGSVAFFSADAKLQINKLKEFSAIKVELNLGPGLRPAAADELKDFSEMILQTLMKKVDQKLKAVHSSLEAEAKKQNGTNVGGIQSQTNGLAGAFLRLTLDARSDVFSGRDTIHYILNEQTVQHDRVSSTLEGLQNSKGDFSDYLKTYTLKKQRSNLKQVQLACTGNDWSIAPTVRVSARFPKKGGGTDEVLYGFNPSSKKKEPISWTVNSKDNTYIVSFETFVGSPDEISITKAIAFSNASRCYPDAGIESFTTDAAAVNIVGTTSASLDLSISMVDIVQECSRYRVELEHPRFGGVSFLFRKSNDVHRYVCHYGDADRAEDIRYRVTGMFVHAAGFHPVLTVQGDWHTFAAQVGPAELAVVGPQLSQQQIETAILYSESFTKAV